MWGPSRKVIVIVDGPTSITGFSGVPCSPPVHPVRSTIAVKPVEPGDSCCWEPTSQTARSELGSCENGPHADRLATAATIATMATRRPPDPVRRLVTCRVWAADRPRDACHTVRPTILGLRCGSSQGASSLALDPLVGAPATVPRERGGGVRPYPIAGRRRALRGSRHASQHGPAA